MGRIWLALFLRLTRYINRRAIEPKSVICKNIFRKDDTYWSYHRNLRWDWQFCNCENFLRNLVSAPYARGRTFSMSHSFHPWTIRPVCTGMNLKKRLEDASPKDLPLRTGMNLRRPQKWSEKIHLPRMRGDEPLFRSISRHTLSSAPYARGWPDGTNAQQWFRCICPVCTGMTPWFLHFTHCRMRSAPCIRGWTIPGWFCSRYWRIHSVRTGMSLSLLHSSHHNANPPRIHGDKSIPYCLRDHRKGSALHTQG